MNLFMIWTIAQNSRLSNGYSTLKKTLLNLYHPAAGLKTTIGIFTVNYWNFFEHVVKGFYISDDCVRDTGQYSLL